MEKNRKAKTTFQPASPGRAKKNTKAKTTFRPTFSGRENCVSDSASRAPTNHPPPSPRSTNPTTPIPASRHSPVTPLSYPLTPTPTAAHPYRTAGLLPSSCPPSSPLAGHDEDSGAVDTGDLEGKGRKGGPYKKAHKKSKGKQKATASEDELSDHTQSEGQSKNKGRLPQAVKAEAFAIRQRYQDELEALAKKSGKNLSTLLEAIGDIVPDTRAVNSWNAYQCYAVNPDGLGLVRQETQTEAEFTADIRERYVKLRDGESEPSEFNLDGVLEWYRKEILEGTAVQRAGGYTKKEIEKFCGPFINRVSFLHVQFILPLTVSVI